jgi:hypothetical protein
MASEKLAQAVAVMQSVQQHLSELLSGQADQLGGIFF